MNKKTLILSILYMLFTCSNLIFAASYPTAGYSEGPAYIEVFIPASTSSAELLGADYDYDPTVYDNPLNGNLTNEKYIDLDGDGTLDTPYRDDYVFADGDYIYTDTTTSYLLVTPDYITYPELYGYLIMDWDNSGDFSSGDYAGGSPLGGVYDVFFTTPIGNGELVLIFLILSYTGFILYKNRKKLFKTKKVEV